jgi:hypothetical protein
VDAQAGTVSISVRAGAGSKVVVVHTTPATSFKRYAPDSVKWEDATASSLQDIHPGDQLRAKGNRSADGGSLDAEAIVDGTFRNLAGLITMIDTAQGTLTLQDLATKKPVTVRISTDSQMRKLPPQMAQGLAMRLKGGGQPPPDAAKPAGDAAAGPGARPRSGDLNQMLARLPAASLADLQKGEAVMIVSTLGSEGRLPAAVTLLGGVEPILTAAPNGHEADSLLTPWSLASAPGGGDQP